MHCQQQERVISHGSSGLGRLQAQGSPTNANAMSDYGQKEERIRGSSALPSLGPTRDGFALQLCQISTSEERRKSQLFSRQRAIIQTLTSYLEEGSTMRHLNSYFVLTAFLFLTCAALAQENTSTETATCNFDADKQLAAEYQRVSVNPKKPLFGREIPSGKVWAPGGKPMTLFTNTPVEIGGANLAVGAYTMYVIPNTKQWTLIISKNTDTSGKYDEKMDLVRVPMESGELAAPESQLEVSFGHIAPDQCTLRLELATTGAWAVFQKR
jgi:Protein of unknown function (DUF2911)